MRLSTLLAPTSRNNPGKVKDRAVIALVKGGYALYEAASDKLLFLPLGQVALENVFDLFDDLCRHDGAQSIDSGGHPQGALAVAARVVKQAEQLPLTLFDRQGRCLELLRLDAEQSGEEKTSLLGLLRNELEERGLDPVLIEEPHSSGSRLRLALRGSEKARNAIDGLACPHCGWGGTAHSPAGQRQGEPMEPSLSLEEAHTPGADTIAELCRQLDVPPERTLKTMFYAVEKGADRDVVVVLMRGDCKISNAKVAAFFGADSVRFATPVELHETMGTLGGYLGPVGLHEGVTIVADENVVAIADVAVGANKPDHHLTGAAWGRDFKATAVADLLALEVGQPCPTCGAALEEACWRVVADVTPLKDLPEGIDITYRGEDRKPHRPDLLRGHLDGEALLLALFDGQSPWLPLDLAPFQILVTPWGEPESPSARAAESLEESLTEAGFAVLHDDRFAKTAVREADFEGLALPIRIAVTDEGDGARAKVRLGDEEADLPLDDAPHALLHLLGEPCDCTTP